MGRLRYWLRLAADPQKLWHDLHIWWLRKQGMSIDQGVTIRFPLHYRHPENIMIREGATIGEDCYLIAGPKSWLVVSSDVLLAPRVHVNTTSHVYGDRDVRIKEQGGRENNIWIEQDCWVGTGAVILAGTIGRGSVVGANSVVTKDVEPYSVVAGNPAVKIKERGQ